MKSSETERDVGESCNKAGAVMIWETLRTMQTVCNASIAKRKPTWRNRAMCPRRYRNELIAWERSTTMNVSTTCIRIGRVELYLPVAEGIVLDRSFVGTSDTAPMKTDGQPREGLSS